MLKGVKFISRDQIDSEENEEVNVSKKGRRKSSSKKEERRTKKSSRYSSSDDEELEKIKKGSKKKWYSSDEYSSEYSSDDDSKGSSDGADNGKKKGKYRASSKSKADVKSKKKLKGRKRDYFSGSEIGGHRSKSKIQEADDDGELYSVENINIVRKEMGLEWMTKPAEKVDRGTPSDKGQPEDPQTEMVKKANPKELNPYLKDNGTGYPEEANHAKPGGDQLLSSSLVGDGGASWRLKALKRAKEQAEREGQSLGDVVEERWGSMGHLAVSVASRAAAAPRAHLNAIKSRKMSASGEGELDSSNQTKRGTEENVGREYLKDVTLRRPEMRAPKMRDTLSWGKRKGQSMHNKDAALISSAVSSINKFADDGSFMSGFMSQKNKAGHASDDVPGPKSERNVELESDSAAKKPNDEKQPLSANQLAAKALQLRMKGKHEEADKLMKEAENAKVQQTTGERSARQRNEGSTSRYIVQDIKMRQKGAEDDGDMHLAQRIMNNRQYSVPLQADDEYDFDDAPAKKGGKKGAGNDKKIAAQQNLANRIMTQQERCQFCFENPNRPKHLVVAIANFTYLMLPPYQPVVPGHCYILPMQHESGTRTVDDNMWEEIRNFKKCLIMMFAKHDKEMVFLETVMGLAQQRRHCLIECIPLPQDIAKQAPLYFKKAIDEAEEEWSQHNAKRLIDTSQKGLRASVPKNFPYFHVEFGLNRGFVHVIDDESQFKSSLGLNVIRGMLELPEEDMYRRRRYETVEAQKQAVAAFSREWEHFDWTKQLD